MVVFTCGHCGESVQKPKVEKHYQIKCRNRSPNLSCMDCFKDFLGNDYEGHIKCITEEERYSGKGFTAKEKKGEKKQNAWVEMLQSVLDEQRNASKNVLRIIETISKHNNTPRKKPKFINFVKNVCGHKTNPKDIDQAWDLISVKLAALANFNAQNKNQPQKENGNEGAPKSNGNSNDKELNGDAEHSDDEKENTVSENGTSEKVKTEVTDAGNEDEENCEKENKAVIDKKLSKKQRKEEKKRLKYEAELQSAVLPPEEEEEKIQTNKKGKKNKNKIDVINGDNNNVPVEGKNKNKKRKRQDTVGAASDTNEINTEDVAVQPVKKEKEKKKKLKVDGEEEVEAEESICLHDQNVAKAEEEVTADPGNFNWHAVIMSVLEKKGNEVPFKRLQKKVLGEYAEATGCEVDDRIADKFIKKLKSAPNVRVDKNRVWLVTDD